MRTLHLVLKRANAPATSDEIRAMAEKANAAIDPTRPSAAEARTRLMRGVRWDPKWTVVQGLRVVPYAEIECVPDGFHILGPLEIESNPTLRTVGDRVHIAGHLTLNHCRKLVTVGAYLRVDKDCGLSYCWALESIAANARIQGGLMAAHNRKLAVIGANLNVDGDCDLSHCSALKSIGDGVRVTGVLNLTGCNPLLALPARGHVGELILPHSFAREVPRGLLIDRRPRVLPAKSAKKSKAPQVLPFSRPTRAITR